MLCCFVVGGDSRLPFSAALGLAAVLGLAFFGVRARWITVVGIGPQTPSPRRSALGLAAEIDLAFFGVRASYIFEVRGNL
jgi:hypothetical protein